MENTTNLEALFDAVIVKPLDAEGETMFGSIIVPDAGKDRNEKGTIVAVGPGVGNYKFKASLSSSLSAADESILYEQINQLISNKIPGYNIVFENDNLKKNGVASINTLGYRFMINLGYRF